MDVLFSDGKFAKEETIKAGGYVLLEGKASQNWLQVDLVDDLNLKGLGSRVTVTADGTQTDMSGVKVNRLLAVSKP
ncbi:hypothetical protein N9Y74_03455 [Alphaproteobacteria bacterium]|nr:hypothetical protein [Alphaproteobacteria bacterium]